MLTSREEASSSAGTIVKPNPEVEQCARRRRFTAEYKLRILREAEACRGEGQIGALLRREGLYFSHLASWRRAHARVGETGMKAQKRGPKAKERHPLEKKVAELERENRRLQKRVEKQEAIIDFQKKVHELLGIPLKSHASEESD
jgi:transposase-like protein